MWYTHNPPTHTHNGTLFSYEKGWNLAICNNMKELRGCYAKWSKSDIERQIPYDLTTMQNLKKTTVKTK